MKIQNTIIRRAVKHLLALSMLCSIPGFATAQIRDEFENSTPEERARFQTEWMEDQLTLDSLTTEKANEINLKYANKMEGYKSANLSRYELIKEFQKVSEKKDLELKKIFSSGQYALYQDKKKEMRAHFKEHMRASR